jgi:hypothetical protein
VLFAAVLVAVSACGSGVAVEDNNLASAVRAMLGNDFTGKYVKVTGTRSPAATPLYPCVSEFEACLGLDATGATASIQDLCPSDNTPEGTWAFKYIVYKDAGCTTAITNFGCMPELGEWLSPGHNHNDVVCITRNSDKSFDLCVVDPVTGAGSEACPPCIPIDGQTCP